MLDSCLKKPVLIAGAVTAVFTWAYDFAVHGHLLKEKYEATARMWRSEAQMQELLSWCVVYHVFMAVIFAAGYWCWREKAKLGKVGSDNCPYRKSLGFGLWVGLLLAAPQLMTYVWLPLETTELPVAWAASELVKWTLAGALLNKLYKPA